jgi:TolB-like protein
MERHFPAYKGDDPYFFISYAHRDEELIYDELEWLIKSDFNVWYDEGIDVGVVWRQALADALAEASGLIFFATKHSVASKNCLNEISFAMDEDIQVFVVNLDDTVLPRQLRFALNDKQILVRSAFSLAKYREKLNKTLHTAIHGIANRQNFALDGESGNSVDGTADGIAGRSAGHAANHTPHGDTTLSVKTNIPTIFILPFSCPSDDTALTFYAENIAADIARGMESASINIVTGHPSDKALDTKEICLKYSVEYVLSGSLVRIDECVRARALLVETKKGKQVWAKNYEPTDTQLAKATTAIADAISANVVMATPVFETMRISEIPTRKLDAWALGIKSINMPIKDHKTASSWKKVALRAIELDDNLAEVHANLADGLVSIITANLSLDLEQDKADAIAHSYKALSIRRDKVFVLNRCSRVHRILGNVVLALDLALQVDELTTGQFTYTLYPTLMLNGRYQEVIDHTHSNELAALAWSSDACVLMGDFTLAEKWVRKSIAKKPEKYQRWMRLANILGHTGQKERGIEALTEAQRIGPEHWSIDNYKAELNSIWRNNQDIVAPLVEGLNSLKS